jgi:hypothetical protein
MLITIMMGGELDVRGCLRQRVGIGTHIVSIALGDSDWRSSDWRVTRISGTSPIMAENRKFHICLYTKKAAPIIMKAPTGAANRIHTRDREGVSSSMHASLDRMPDFANREVPHSGSWCVKNMDHALGPARCFADIETEKRKASSRHLNRSISMVSQGGFSR